MNIKKFHLYLADLNPRFGSEPGKTRPVIVVQTNLLNDLEHPTTLICPISSKKIENAEKIEILRISVTASKANGLKKQSYILIDQLRAIDNNRILQHLGVLQENLSQKLKESLQIVLFE